MGVQDDARTTTALGGLELAWNCWKFLTVTYFVGTYKRNRLKKAYLSSVAANLMSTQTLGWSLSGLEVDLKSPSGRVAVGLKKQLLIKMLESNDEDGCLKRKLYLAGGLKLVVAVSVVYLLPSLQWVSDYISFARSKGTYTYQFASSHLHCGPGYLPELSNGTLACRR